MAEELSPEINKQLIDINKKLSNVITKWDSSLREMIREICAICPQIKYFSTRYMYYLYIHVWEDAVYMIIEEIL